MRLDLPLFHDPEVPRVLRCLKSRRDFAHQDLERRHLVDVPETDHEGLDTLSVASESRFQGRLRDAMLHGSADES